MIDNATTLTFISRSNAQVPVGELVLEGTQLRPLAGGYILWIPASVAYDNLCSEQVCLDLCARVAVGVGSSSEPIRDLGTARGDAMVFLTPAEVPTSRPSRRADLSMRLTREDVAFIETLRLGRSLDFVLRVEGVAHIAGDVHAIASTPHLPKIAVSQSEWTNLLTSAGYGEYMIIELSVPNRAVNSPLAEAVRYLRNAQHALWRGDVEEAVGDCRPALEILARDGDSKYERHRWSRSATKEERFWRVVDALRTVTHPAHHADDQVDSGERGGSVNFQRADAEALIAALAAMVHQRLT